MMIDPDMPAVPMSAACKASALSVTLEDSIGVIANRQRIARTLDGHWMRSVLGFAPAPQWLALTDAEIEAAKGVQSAVKRLLDERPEPVDVPAEWPLDNVVPFRRIDR